VLERILFPVISDPIISGFIISFLASVAAFFLLGELMRLRRYDPETISRTLPLFIPNLILLESPAHRRIRSSSWHSCSLRNANHLPPEERSLWLRPADPGAFSLFPPCSSSGGNESMD
jgi:hypothetical protein